MPSNPVPWPVGIILGGLGLLMLFWRLGPNPWIGVRLPWTYADREIWDQSYRLAAWLVLLLGLTALISLPAFLGATVVLLVGCIALPWRWYYQKYGTSRWWKDEGCLAYKTVARCRHCGHYQKLADAAALSQALCEACGLPLRR